MLRPWEDAPDPQDQCVDGLAPALAQARLDCEKEFRRASELCRSGRLLEAEAIYEHVILRLFPNNFHVLHYLGQLRLKQGQVRSAITLLRAALAANVESPEAYSDLGRAFDALNQQEESLELFQNAVAIKPDYAGAHNNLGTSLKALGRLDEAAEAFKIAIALAPREPRSYYNLVHTQHTVPGDPHVAAMENLATDMRQLLPTQQLELHFGLGKLYADLRMNEQSFEHYYSGNALKRQQTVYDEGNTLRNIDNIRRVFTAEVIGSQRVRGHPSELPIFIFGMPRSGTTLVEQILASHPAVFGAGEVSEFGTRRTWAGPVLYLRATPDDRSWCELGIRYVEHLSAIGGCAARVTDKMPSNFMSAGLIHLVLPNARMIHVRRDPVDTCLSCFSVLFKQGHPYTYDLGELGKYYNAYDRLMAHWRDVLPSRAMIEVHYEELVADLEGQARRLLKYCDLDWNEACLSFHKTERPVRTASAIQVRQPLYGSSVNRWRPGEEILRPLLSGLGKALS